MKKIILFLLPVALMLASCRSSKKVTNDEVNTPKIETTTVVNQNTNTKNEATKPSEPKETNFTAKVKVTITRGDQNISTNGMLRMRYNDVIQLTLVDPILGITEVGRMELSPDNMLIIDRINKRYVSAGYNEIEALRSKNIDFNAIQALFWEEAEKSNDLSYTIPMKTSIKLDLKLSGKGHSDGWDAHTSVSSKYTKTDADKLFKSLVQ